MYSMQWCWISVKCIATASKLYTDVIRYDKNDTIRLQHVFHMYIDGVVVIVAFLAVLLQCFVVPDDDNEDGDGADDDNNDDDTNITIQLLSILKFIIIVLVSVKLNPSIYLRNCVFDIFIQIENCSQITCDCI